MSGKELFERHWRKHRQLEQRHKTGDRVVTDLAFIGDNGGFDFDEINVQGIEAGYTACQISFSSFKGLTLSIGLPIDEDDESGWLWRRGNMRQLFMDFLSSYDGYEDAEAPDNPDLRAVARILREWADMTDYVVSENQQKRFPTRKRNET